MARFIERSGYYGVRAIIVIYAVTALELPREKAFFYYQTMTTISYLAMFIGGIISDVTRGNKWVALGSGVFEVIGILLFITQDANLVLAGGILFGFGSGGFVAANLSAFARTCFNDSKKLLSGWTLYYALINIGAFLGIWFASSQVEWDGPFHYYGVFYAAIAVIATGTILTFLNTPEFPEVKRKKSTHPARDLVMISLSVLFISIFWFCVEVFGGQISLWSYEITLTDSNPNPDFYLDTNGYTMIFAGIVLFLLFSQVKVRTLRLLSIGFLLAAAAYALFTVVPNLQSNLYEIIIVHSIILTLAELLIWPVLLSIQTLHSNPRYVGIIMGGGLLAGALIHRFILIDYLHKFDKIHWHWTSLILIFVLLGIAVVWFVLQFFLKDRFSFEPLHTNEDEDFQLKEDEILD